MHVHSCSFEHYGSDSYVLARFHDNFDGEHPGSGQWPPTFLFLFHQPHKTSGSMTNLEYLHAMKALHIYKHPCICQNSNPGPTAQ
ncbi:hypothetical protein TNCV_1415021 [Trichonephila clavipes]|nr:hypothetical protein TNCV_1415021 [Trichonephila clavipes]